MRVEAPETRRDRLASILLNTIITGSNASLVFWETHATGLPSAFFKTTWTKGGPLNIYFPKYSNPVLVDQASVGFKPTRLETLLLTGAKPGFRNARLDIERVEGQREREARVVVNIDGVHEQKPISRFIGLTVIRRLEQQLNTWPPLRISAPLDATPEQMALLIDGTDIPDLTWEERRFYWSP